MSRAAELTASERAPGLLLGEGVELPDSVQLGGAMMPQLRGSTVQVAAGLSAGPAVQRQSHENEKHS